MRQSSAQESSYPEAVCQSEQDEPGAASVDATASWQKSPSRATAADPLSPVIAHEARRQGLPVSNGPVSVTEVLQALQELELLSPEHLMEARQFHRTASSADEFVQDLVQRGWLTPFQRGLLLQGRGHELILSGYVLLDRLGEGGMGVIYRARQTQLNRIVALKMIRAGSFATAELQRRFQLEAEAVARLQHEHIVKLFEVGDHRGCPFFTLEYMAGGNLARKLRGAPQPAREAARLVQTLARAMDYAHRQGILHRDLKPLNILLTAHGTPKISDFGLVKFLQDQVDLTPSTELIGTPSYMAPEQTGRKFGRVGPATDVYALGAILYELLTGRPPFRADSSWETIRQLQHEEPISPAFLRPGLARDLETICLKCLRKEPVRRYATAAALADDLGRFLEARPIQARPVGMVGRTWCWCRRNPVLTALLVVLILGLAGIASQWWRASVAQEDAEQKATLAHKQQERAEHSERVQGGQLYALAIKSAADAWRTGNLKRMQTLLEQLRPRAGQPDWRGFEWYYLQRLLQPAGRTVLGGHHGFVDCLAFSPNGRMLATGDDEGTIRLWNAATGRLMRSLELPASPGLSFTVEHGLYRVSEVAAGSSAERDGHLKSGDQLLALGGPDGKSVTLAAQPPGAVADLLGGPDGSRLQVTILRAGHSKPRRYRLTRRTSRSPLTQLAFHHQGRWLAAGYENGTLCLWDVHEGRLRRARPLGCGPIRSVAFAPRGDALAIAARAGSGLCTVRDGDLAASTIPISGGGGLFAFSPDGRTLIQAGPGKQIGWREANTGRSLASLMVPLVGIESLALSPDGRLLAVAGTSGMIGIVDMAKRSLLRTFAGSSSSIGALGFSRDSRTLVSSNGNRVVFWDPATGLKRGSLAGHTAGVRCVAFSPDGRALATGSCDHTAMLWNLHRAPAQQEAELRPGPTACLQALAAVPGGTRLAFAGGYGPAPGALGLLDLDRNERVFFPANENAHQPAVLTVAVSPDSRLMASGGDDHAIQLWDMASAQVRATLPGHQDAVTTLAFSPDGKTLASGSKDRTVRLWDVNTRRQLESLPAEPTTITSVVFVSQHRLIYGTAAGHVLVYDLSAHQVVGHLSAPAIVARPPMAVAPDGDTVILGGTARGLILWHSQTGEERVLLGSEEGTVEDVAISPDGKTLAALCDDHTVKLWQLPGGEELFSLAHHFTTLGLAPRLIFSADGRLLAAGGPTATVPATPALESWRARRVATFLAAPDAAP